MPAALAHLILKKSHGNPLVVTEMVYDLRKTKLITVDEKNKVTASPDLLKMSTNPAGLFFFVLCPLY